MDLEEISYIAESISKLAVVPVRLYDGAELVFRHMPVNLDSDPADLVLQGLRAMRDNVGYLIFDDFFYFGVVNSDRLKLVVGPLRETPADDLAYRRMGIQLSVAPADIDRFILAMRSISPMPFYTALQILCTMNFVMNGEKLSLDELVIHDDAQELLTRQLAEESFRKNEFRDVLTREHTSEQVEHVLTDFIKRGQPDALRDYLAHVPSFKAGTLSADRLRHEKNTFIAGAAIMSRAAIAGGVDADDAFTLSDSYINRCELLADPSQIYDLYYHMVMEYAEMVRRVRVGGNPSELVVGVAGYVRRHIFEPIKTEDVARALFVSRGFLSTRFKQETGTSLSDFIQQEKVEEAKRLLTRTSQPLLAISTYLGFSSQSHFNTVFKKRVGMTPRQYRSKRP